MIQVYCSAVRSVVAGQGIKGGPLFDTTKAWFNLLRLIVAAMKRGYIVATPSTPDSSDPENVVNSDDETTTCEETSAASACVAKNFLVMKRRNAFWKLEHRDSLTASTSAPTSAGAASLLTHQASESAFHSMTSPRIASTRKFSVQF